jgi:hypothetical protein
MLNSVAGLQFYCIGNYLKNITNLNVQVGTSRLDIIRVYRLFKYAKPHPYFSKFRWRKIEASIKYWHSPCLFMYMKSWQNKASECLITLSLHKKILLLLEFNDSTAYVLWALIILWLWACPLVSLHTFCVIQISMKCFSCSIRLYCCSVQIHEGKSTVCYEQPIYFWFPKPCNYFVQTANFNALPIYPLNHIWSEILLILKNVNFTYEMGYWSCPLTPTWYWVSTV